MLSVARQHLGSISKVDSRIVSVNAYSIYQNITFPLKLRVFKPKETLKIGSQYFNETELAVEILKEVVKFWVKIKLVLADIYIEEKLHSS
jgi:SRSO17 transposase